MRADLRSLALALALLATALAVRPAFAEELPEYRLKAAFIYNFAQFTEWPAEVGDTLHLCIVGDDPFGEEIDGLQGRSVGARTLQVRRLHDAGPLRGCEIVFVAASAIGRVHRVLDEIGHAPVLTVADTPDAARQGIAINMAVANNKVSFEVNLQAARAAHIDLSSKLLRLATDVHQ